MKRNKILIFIMFVFILFLSFGCKKEEVSKKENQELLNCSVEHETEFGGVYVHNTINEFNDLGFKYGDSVNIKFSNGKELDDIPYYNGYYTKNGETLLVAYPGYPYIKICINNGEDIWDDLNLLKSLQAVTKVSLWKEMKLTSDVKVSIYLNEEAKYLDVQKARDIHYSDDINDYPKGVGNYVFANFRSLRGGNLKENIIFRSASPCDNQHNRAKVVNDLIEKNGVNYILDLADNDLKIESYMEKADFESNYFKKLYEDGKVLPLALNMNFESNYFKGQTLSALRGIVENDGPYLIHCTEGKDRTGFLCLLVEALAGASYREIVEDYMTTYFNYYSLLNNFDKNKYDTIVSNVLNPMIDTIVGNNKNYDELDFAEFAKNYLISNGMDSSEIDIILNKICVNN